MGLGGGSPPHSGQMVVDRPPLGQMGVASMEWPNHSGQTVHILLLIGHIENLKTLLGHIATF
jgi:hypothetical protein